MKKRNALKWVSFGLLWLSGVAVAQPVHMLTSARPVDSGGVRPVRDNSPALATPARTFEELRMVPLFGETAKSAEHIEWEIRFLNDCDQNFATREEASTFFAARGWDYLTEGQLDTAVHRFNLAYVLNPRNADSYWGMGVVTYQRNQLPEAVQLLRKGVEVVDTNAVLITDLATIQLKLYETTRDGQLLTDAVAWLNRSAALRPDYASTFVRLSWAHFAREEYATAWTHLHRARAIDLSSIDVTYLQQLLSRMPDPQGFFK